MIMLIGFKKIACGSNRKQNTENAGLMESLDTHSTWERESKHKNLFKNNNSSLYIECA